MGTTTEKKVTQMNCPICGSDQIVPQLAGSPSHDAVIANFLGLLFVGSSANDQIKWRCMNCMNEFDIVDRQQYDNLVEYAIGEARMNKSSIDQLRQSWQGKVALQRIVFGAAGIGLMQIKLKKESAGPPTMVGLENGKWVEFDWNADQFDNIQFFVDAKQRTLETYCHGECIRYLCISQGNEVEIRKVEMQIGAREGGVA